MRQLKEDIKNGIFHKIYLLYGEERFLVNQYKQMLKKVLGFDENGMNSHLFVGKDSSISKMIDLAQTLPFFAEKRIFLLENTGFFKASGEELGEYLKDAPETACFLLVEKEVDKRSKLYKVVKEKGYIIEFKEQDFKTLQQWVGSLLKNNNKKIKAEIAEYFLNIVGSDMGTINQEIEKLICYMGEKEIVTKADIDNICIPQIGNHIFDLISEIANKNKEKSLKLYHELLALKEPPLRILSLIEKQYQKLLLLKSLQNASATQNEISDTIQVPSYYISKYVAQGRKYSSQSVKKCFQLCVETEEMIKTGKMKDVLALEVLIISLLYDIEVIV